MRATIYAAIVAGISILAVSQLSALSSGELIVVMSYEEIDALMTAPGQPFEIEQIDVAGRSFRDWKSMISAVKK